MGRAARQGDPGSAQIYASLKDEIPGRFNRRLARMLHNAPGRQGKALPSATVRRLFRRAESEAEQTARKHRVEVMRADDWLASALGQMSPIT